MHNFYNRKRKLFLFFISILIVIYFYQVYDMISIPSKIDIYKGENENFNVVFPFTLNIYNEKKNNVSKLNGISNKIVSINLRNSYNLKTFKKGITKMELKLLGLVPIKNIKVNVVDRIYLVPGGCSIGVKVNTKGVLVVALSEITGKDGEQYNPAGNANIKIGDLILEINGTRIKDSNQVINILNKIKDNKVAIKVQRNDEIFTTYVKPVKSKTDNCYRLGLWVRDKTAGIGTLTFYDEKTKKFAALGHGIRDINTTKLMPIDSGEIMEAKISSIEQGKKGTPGEIRGIFFESNNILGKIDKNTEFGIYGTINNNLKKLTTNKAMPIATQREVQEGKAYILTTTKENKVDMYEIYILKKEIQNTPRQKSMVIKITDKELLKKTGGIVQGMSGSPIIQHGKLVGAVTHVFINDPTKGYGLYIEWMLENANISLFDNSKFANAE